MNNVDTRNLYIELEALALELQTDLSENENIDYICNKLTNRIYESCIKNKKENESLDTTDIPHYSECTSQNIRAISSATFECFQYHILNRSDVEVIQRYQERWMRYENIANQKENEEHNTRINKRWSKCAKDGKKLWSLVDWKGQVQEDSQNDLSYHEIYKFFIDIFQSSKTSNSPVITDALAEMNMYNVNIPITDMDITIEEVNSACIKIGKGTGIDGLPPAIAKVLPQSLKDIIQTMFQRIFTGEYPKEWQNQLLFPIKKKGHTINTPKLRGIGIGPLFGRIYDDVINQRLCLWFTPNLEQAMYRSGQGGVLQIFALLLLIEYAKEKNKSIFIGLLDFEKAFDFTNRSILISDLMNKGIGKGLVQAIYNMYLETAYTPKLSKNLIGDEITTKFGVTQGRKTSGTLYACTISDMPNSIHTVVTNDFMDPNCLAQVADDTSIIAETLESLKMKFQGIFNYTLQKHQHINAGKTKYMHMSHNHTKEAIELENGDLIEAMDEKEGYSFIGFKLTYTDDIYELVKNNLNSKMFNIPKFYAWLEDNETTPFFIKLKVLHSCLFQALLYSAEAWGNLKEIESGLRIMEQKALKCCLGVKGGTTNDIVYLEINKADIIAAIKDRQYNFAIKIKKLGPGEALVKEIWDFCVNQNYSNTNLISYYNDLNGKECIQNIIERKERIMTSNQTMCARYKDLIGMNYCSVLYDSCLDDTSRTIITRWRLSSHSLQIEKGRYTRPITDEEERKCKVCLVVEDEIHAILQCKAHRLIRERYKDRLNFQAELIDILNPRTISEAIYLAKFLNELEENMEELKML